MPLEHLEQVQAAAADAATALFAVMSSGSPGGEGLTPAAFAATHSRLLAPTEEALQQYGERELAYLGAELGQIAAKGKADVACRSEHSQLACMGSSGAHRWFFLARTASTALGRLAQFSCTLVAPHLCLQALQPPVARRVPPLWRPPSLPR